MNAKINKDDQIKIGYCTNVHAGVTLEQVKQNLLEHGSIVRQQLNNRVPLPVGLWLSDEASRELDDDSLQGWRDWLAEHQFIPYTLNGFPFSDFHQDVVKQDVYLPTWAERPRLNYTVRLAKILDAILPPGESGSISTLPLGWPSKAKDRSKSGLLNTLANEDHATVRQSAVHLKELAIELDRIRQDTGRLIQVCIEPEPGCILETAGDIVCFFEEMLLNETSVESIVRNHLGVCHDVCHSAVMFEPQQLAIADYQKAGIDVGKVQVSSAVEMPSYSAANLEELRAFAEPRYLHQTVIDASDGQRFYEDLAEALESNDAHIGSDCRWRVHFHVPIFLEHLGRLRTTQAEIRNCISALNRLPDANRPSHFEVETYAWNVLPKRHAVSSLAFGIAEELHWFENLLTELENEDALRGPIE